MELRKESEIKDQADKKWEQRGQKIPEAIRERVKAKFYKMVNEPDTMRGLQLVKTETKVNHWINKLFEGAHKLVKKGLD